MTFEESIIELTNLFESNYFHVSDVTDYSKSFSLNEITIKIVKPKYGDSLEAFIYEKAKFIVELRPKIISEFFKDDRFILQSFLTISDLISFLNSSGKSLLSGDTVYFNELKEYSAGSQSNFFNSFMQEQNLRLADKAWEEKNFASFVEAIDQTNKALLQPSYLKKYKIALGKLNM